MTKLVDLTETALPKLLPRQPDSHKGDFGRAVLVGGSRGMSGAMSLAGQATLRGGAGLVTLAVPRSIQDVVAAIEPSYMTHGLLEDEGQIAFLAVEEVLKLAASATALAIGPGLGRGASLTDFAVRLQRDVDKPAVIDADGLFALAERSESLVKPGGPRVLTPHPGEFERLTGERLQVSRRAEAAAQLAQRDSSGRTVVVLKGHETVVTDGQRYSLNHTGNPGMATGGSGDVLTGMITALLCQGVSPFDAARLGVHVHGLAGDLAAAELGQVSLIASDLIEYLPKAFQSLTDDRRPI
ncbi:MAG: NAD(P)H-hydrate dehydratase [Pirellulales bacterium]